MDDVQLRKGDMQTLVDVRPYVATRTDCGSEEWPSSGAEKVGAP